MGSSAAPRSLLLRLRLAALAKRAKPNGAQADWAKVSQLMVLVALPATLAGIWNVGVQISSAMVASATSELIGWQHILGLHVSALDAGPLFHFWLGFLYFLPLLLVCFVTCRLWDKLFTRHNTGVNDRDNLLIALLFVLLLPPSMPLGLAALGVSFGIVFGKLIFGGSGRYLVSPPLLGVVFLSYSYPGFFNGQYSVLPITGPVVQTTWSILAEGGVQAVGSQGFSWLALFLGNEISTFGDASALASLLGLLALLVLRRVPWLVPFGAVSGLLLASLFFDAAATESAEQMTWYWHLAVGSFAFTLAFLLTDPTVMPFSRGGCFIYGALFGGLTVLIRTVNPNHPEGSLLALLLVSLLVPLIDWLVIELQRGLTKRKRAALK